jgi:hydroxyacylglutathione hydrolase
MISALSYLATLPEKTIVYAGHEYTAGNAAFAKSVDPHDAGVARLADLAKRVKVSTGESTIGDEKEWNVFMRLGSDAVKFVISSLIVLLLIKVST